MKLKFKNIYLNVEVIFIIFCLVIAFSPTVREYFNGYVICYFFIVFHECAHMLAAGIFGEKLQGVNIRLCGVTAKIKIKNELHPKWILVYFAGPFSNIFLATIFQNIAIVRDVNLGLCIINLLPIHPLDGFNILKILLCWKFSKLKVRKILKYVQIVVIIAIIILGLMVLLVFKNPSIIIFTMYIIFVIN